MIRQKRDTWIVEKNNKVHKFASKDAALEFLGMKVPEPLPVPEVEEFEIIHAEEAYYDEAEEADEDE